MFPLYGNTRKPTDEMAEGIGRIAIGPQGIGVRRYTRLATLDLSWGRIILY